MKKALTLGVAAGIIFAVGVFVALLYRGDTGGDGADTAPLAGYFAERMFEAATAPGIIPVEGFDATLLIGAFSGLAEEDFNGVATGAGAEEGVYLYTRGTLVWKRTARQPISSAERTVTKVGYATLLQNLSTRLAHPVADTGDVDALIARIQNDAEGESANPLKEANNLIRLDAPLPNQIVTSPLSIQGEARGFWFFEASFPVVLVDWDGRIVAEGFVTAQSAAPGEAALWMTEEFVPFKGEVLYTLDDERYSDRGALILKKANPSGLPEHDDALEVPVIFGD